MLEGLSDGPEAEAEAREAKIRAEERIDDMNAVMSTAGGRRMFYSILSEMGAWDGVYSDRGAGKHEAAIEVIIRIKSAGIKNYHLMLEENEA